MIRRAGIDSLGVIVSLATIAVIGGAVMVMRVREGREAVTEDSKREKEAASRSSRHRLYPAAAFAEVSGDGPRGQSLIHPCTDINGVGGRTLRAVCSRNVIWLRVVSSLQLNSQTLAPSIVALTFQEAKDALSLVP